MSRSRRIVLPASVSALLAAGVLAALPAPAYAAGEVVINEVESQDPSGGSDWVELKNNGANPVDISSWVLKDSGDSNNVTIPPGTIIGSGQHLAFDVTGLGDGDVARLVNNASVLIDDFVITDHAAGGTWSRCPNGLGDFIGAFATKGTPNACIDATPWQGGTAVVPVDDPNTIGSDLSGLAYEGSGSAAAGTLWAVQNGGGLLHRLTRPGATWGPAATYALTLPGGVGQPDAEGVTLTGAGAAGGVYVSSERDGTNNGTSRPSVLRYVPSGPSGALSPTNEWNLTADLPGLESNGSLEAIAWVPDSYLTARGFRATGGTVYDPAAYPNHGTGLFFVGVEQDGRIIAYALDHTNNTFTRVATVDNVFQTVADLDFDAELQRLRVVCDNNCNGRTALYDVTTAAGPTQGQFASTAVLERPTGMANLNNEGFTVTPRSECVGGLKPVFWADDGNTGGHALRAGTIACTPFAPPTITATASSAKPRTAAGWYGAPVTVTFACTPGSAPLTAPCPAPVVLGTSGADQTVTRTVTNGDGLSASATVGDVDVDLVAPTAKVKGVKKGKTYAKKKKATCKATDGLSGIASCKVSQKAKKTATGKKYTVTATATDRAGNVTVVKVRYKVVAQPTKKKS